jgi:hypothetical protein
MAEIKIIPHGTGLQVLTDGRRLIDRFYLVQTVLEGLLGELEDLKDSKLEGRELAGLKHLHAWLLDLEDGFIDIEEWIEGQDPELAFLHNPEEGETTQ